VTTVRISLPAGTMAVPAARGFTSDTLRGWQVSERTVETVELVVSELVGNAVEHGGGSSELSLSLLADVIRVDVVDPDPNLPVVLSPEPIEDRHRGLLIVSALSTNWGTDRIGSGKSVWAELAIGDISADQDEPAPSPAAADGRSLSG
jgi:anti-sigma regulatory factor (Ser/Thr protein kinase)